MTGTYQGWQITAPVSAGPGCAADDFEGLELELQTDMTGQAFTRVLTQLLT